MKPSMAAAEVTARLQEASRASDLDAARRLDSKIDLTPQGVTLRLREASDLLNICRRLAELRPKA
jgi:hypothetical protein